jgi:CRISPR/Cas system CMR subunit Cmr4 (Cas7 group RAMP superfamily)
VRDAVVVALPARSYARIWTLIFLPYLLALKEKL